VVSVVGGVEEGMLWFLEEEVGVECFCLQIGAKQDV